MVTDPPKTRKQRVIVEMKSTSFIQDVKLARTEVVITTVQGEGDNACWSISHVSKPTVVNSRGVDAYADAVYIVDQGIVSVTSTFSEGDGATSASLSLVASGKVKDGSNSEAGGSAGFTTASSRNIPGAGAILTYEYTVDPETGDIDILVLPSEASVEMAEDKLNLGSVGVKWFEDVEIDNSVENVEN